jgi:hypothetical protein
MTPADRLRDLERSYLVARDARDRLDVARARGEPGDPAALEASALRASTGVHAGIAAFDEDDRAALDADDRRALAVMARGMDAADEYHLPVAPSLEGVPPNDPVARRAAVARGGEALRTYLEACYGHCSERLLVGQETLSRLQVLHRLGSEADPGRRQALFLSLEPLWRVMAGDDAATSPYRALIHEAAQAWRAGRSPVAANAAALGTTPAAIETWALTALAGWRAAVVEPGREAGEPPVEPWDWWWRAGTAARIVGPVPLAEVEAINRGTYAALGADLGELRVRFDIQPRTSRPAVPVAFTTFAARPHRLENGSWSPGEPVVMANLREGGLAELVELLHETGHAIHIAAIRTRPAFTDWPASDALTEALAELVTLDAAEPAWQRRWLPGRPEVPEPLAIRSYYADTVLDAAWALFETRLLADPALDPDEVWTDLTSTWLGIAPHPEWSWWAMRGQLIEEPGSMANYAIGAVLAAAIRSAIRQARGDWLGGDPGWYPWVSEHIYRFGLERSPAEVVHRVLGRPPTADALLAEISRAARVR